MIRPASAGVPAFTLEPLPTAPNMVTTLNRPSQAVLRINRTVLRAMLAAFCR